MTAVEGSVRYTGVMPDGVTIKYATEVWLQDDDDQLVDLAWIRENVPNSLMASPNCYSCWDQFITGVVADKFGIERCDNCSYYDGDMEAAEDLATHLEILLGKPTGSLSIWFIPSTYESESEPNA